MKKTILFDLDGTLIDSTEAVYESFCVSCEFMGFKLPQQKDVLALIGHPLEVMFGRLGYEAAHIEEAVLAYKRHYRTISVPKTRLLEDAKEAVEEAASFANLGVVTTKTGRYSIELLESFGIMHHFKTVIGREDVKRPKPHQEPILKALAAMRSKKEGAWMVGDTCMDIIAAKNAEIDAIGLDSGYGDLDSLRRCAGIILDSAHKAVRHIAAN